MKVRTLSFQLSSAGLLAVGALLSAQAVFAADDARARYEAHVAACQSGASGQDRQACMREAGAALQEARRGRLEERGGEADFAANAARRCDRLPPERREGCMALRSGANVTTQGSVEGGAVLRQTTIRTVGEPQPAAGTMGAPGTPGTMGAPGTMGTAPVSPNVTPGTTPAGGTTAPGGVGTPGTMAPPVNTAPTYPATPAPVTPGMGGTTGTGIR